MFNYKFLINYRNIRNAAWLFLLHNDIKEMPLDLETLALQNNWTLLCYEDNQTLFQIIDKMKLYEKFDGLTYLHDNEIIIMYHRTDNIGRMRFTIAHEFGHIIFMHLTKLNRKDYERQANMFAARILMPMCVIKECGATTAAEISQLCNTGILASSFRASRLKKLNAKSKFYSSALESQVIDQFSEFINNYTKQGSSS